jgi:subtilisin-like proprotein convertase family protein
MCKEIRSVRTRMMRSFAFFTICFSITTMSFGATFPADAPSLGFIPDSDVGSPSCQNNSLTFKDVTFNVTGLSGTLSNVAVSFSASHTFLQDLEVTLRAPGGSPSHLLFSATGTTSNAANTCAGSSNDLSTANIYTFADTASSNWWTTAAPNPVPTSTNRTVVTGIGGTTNPPATTNMNAAFAPTQPNGTWTLRFRDRGAGDTGMVTAASLSLITIGDPFGSAPVDMNGDGKTDWVVVRNTGGGPNGQLTWLSKLNGVAGGDTVAWGLTSDRSAPGDFDGDNKADISVWRPPTSTWYILQSSNGVMRIEAFGQPSDDSSVIGDYNGDGKDDIAIFRNGTAAGDPDFWYWRTAANGPFSVVQWGQNGDFPAPGDYDGDGKNDFVVQRNAGGGQAIFWTLLTNGSTRAAAFGFPTDVIVPGDYDSDGRTDIAIVRGVGSQIVWWFRPSNGGADQGIFLGNSATDFPAPGDYDGDGRIDQAVWRPTDNTFYVNKSSGGLMTFNWGQNGDYPVANYNAH